MSEFENKTLSILKPTIIGLERYRQGLMDSIKIIQIQVNAIDQKILECEEHIFKKEKQEEIK